MIKQKDPTKVQGKRRRRKTTKLKPKLELDFQSNLVDLEFEIEQGSCEVFELIEMYHKAIEYYDSIGDKKHANIFNTKI